MRTREREMERYDDRGGIKASSGNPDWLKEAMQDYGRICLRFSSASKRERGRVDVTADAVAIATNPSTNTLRAPLGEKKNE